MRNDKYYFWVGMALVAVNTAVLALAPNWFSAGGWVCGALLVMGNSDAVH